MRGVVPNSGVTYLDLGGERRAASSSIEPPCSGVLAHIMIGSPPWPDLDLAKTRNDPQPWHLIQTGDSKDEQGDFCTKKLWGWKVVPGGRRFSRRRLDVCWDLLVFFLCKPVFGMDIYPQRSLLGGLTRNRWGTEEICCSSRVSPGPFSFQSVGRSVAKTPFCSGVIALLALREVVVSEGRRQ